MAADAGIRAAAFACSRSYRLSQKDLTVDGRPFALHHGPNKDGVIGYSHLIGFFEDEHPNQVVLKAAQMGLTAAAVLKAIDEAERKRLRGIGYVFPTRDDVSDFSTARFATMIEENPQLAQLVRSTNNTRVRRVGQTPIYFRHSGRVGTGTKGQSHTKSYPADILILDERDEMREDNVESVIHRLDGSENPMLIQFSTPTVPDVGVDYLYQRSNQMVWMRKCVRCNEYNCLELDFPNCMPHELRDLEKPAVYLCSKCREPLVSEMGEWVARKPDITRCNGRWISQLNSPTITPDTMRHMYLEAEEKGRRKEFWRQNLGSAYADIDEQITDQLLNEACKDYPMAAADPGPCAMGVDPGKRDLWYQIRVKHSDRDSKVLRWGCAKSRGELTDLAKKFNVKVCVMDEGAEARFVCDYKSEHRWVWGCFYVNTKRHEPLWKPKEREVHMNRTVILDLAHHDLVSGFVHYPRRSEWFDETVRPQMKNLKRVVTVDDVDGGEDARWVIAGGVKNDHLRHADAYARLAMERLPLAEARRSAMDRQRATGKRPRRSWQSR